MKNLAEKYFMGKWSFEVVIGTSIQNRKPLTCRCYTHPSRRCWPHSGCLDPRSYAPGVIPLLDPWHPLAARPKLPLYWQKTIIQIRVAVIYRPGGIMSPAPDNYSPPAHYLACLIIHLSLVFYPFRRQILREVSPALPRSKKNAYSGGHGSTRKT